MDFKMALLPMLLTSFLISFSQVACQTGSSFFYYYSPNQPMVINSQTYGSNAQAHSQLLPSNSNNNPFNLRNHFGANSNSNTGQFEQGFLQQQQPSSDPYVSSSPFLPRRQQQPQTQNNAYQNQPSYSSSLLDKIAFANAPTTQPTPPELNSYYNQVQEQTGAAGTPPTTSFPGQPQPSAKLFNFLNQPFQFFQNSFNRFSQTPQPQNTNANKNEEQELSDSIPREVPNTNNEFLRNNEENQQYFYNYYSRPNQQQQQTDQYQDPRYNKEPAEQDAYVNSGVNYNNAPPPGTKDRSRQSYLINQYFSTKTTQGPPTSYTFTIGADPTTGPTATVHVNMGQSGQRLPPPPKLPFPSQPPHRLIPVRQYETVNEDLTLPINENDNNRERNPDDSFPLQPQPEAPLVNLAADQLGESDFDETEPLTTTGKPVIMVITNRRTTTEDSQLIISTASSTTTPRPAPSTSTVASTTTTTASPTTMSFVEEQPSSTTTTTEAPATTQASTTTTLATSTTASTTTTSTTTAKPSSLPKQRKVIRKKVPRKRLPSLAKNRNATPEPERDVQPPAPEQDLDSLPIPSNITITQPPARRRTTTTEEPFRITTRRLRLRITTVAPTSSTTPTPSTTLSPQETDTATTFIPPHQEVYTTTRTTTTTPTPTPTTRRVYYTTTTPTATPESSTSAPVYTTTAVEEIIPQTYNSKQPETESIDVRSSTPVYNAEDETEPSTSTTTQPSVFTPSSRSKSRTRTTESPYFIDADVEDDSINVATTVGSIQESSTEPFVSSSTSETTNSTTTATFSSPEVISTESPTITHSKGQPNASPDVNYPEYYDSYEYYDNADTPGQTESSSMSSTTTTPTAFSSSTTKDDEQSTTATFAPELYSVGTTSTGSSSFSSSTASTTTTSTTLIEEHELSVTEEPVSSTTTSRVSQIHEESDSSAAPPAESTTEPILLPEDEVIEPLSTTEAPVSSTTALTQSNDDDDDVKVLARSTEGSVDEAGSSSTVDTIASVASSTEKVESTTGAISNPGIATTEESLNVSSPSTKLKPSEDPVSEEAPAVDYKDLPTISEAGGGEVPVEGNLEEAVAPTSPSSTSESPSPANSNYDDFPDQEEYNYPEDELDPYEDEKIEEAKKQSLKMALQNIRNRQNSTSTTEKPAEEMDGSKKFVRRPIIVKTFSSSSSSSSSGNSYDDDELGSDSRSQVIQKIQTFRTKLRKVTTTKRPRRVTRPSNKSTSTGSPGDLSQNENDIRGNGKDESDNEVSRQSEAISSKNKSPPQVAPPSPETDIITEKEIIPDIVAKPPQGKKEETPDEQAKVTNGETNSTKPNEEPEILSTTTSTTTTTSTIKSISVEESQFTTTAKNAVTHVGELIIHEILPTTPTTSTTEEAPQNNDDVDFDTGSDDEKGQVLEHSTSISVAVSSEFDDEEEINSSTTASTTTTTTSPSSTQRSRRVKVIRGRKLNSVGAATTPEPFYTTTATPTITSTEAALPTTTTTSNNNSSTTTSEEPIVIVATEVSFNTNISESEASSPAPQRKVKVILKRRKGVPNGGKVTVARQVVRTRTRSRPKTTNTESV